MIKILFNFLVNNNFLLFDLCGGFLLFVLCGPMKPLQFVLQWHAIVKRDYTRPFQSNIG